MIVNRTELDTSVMPFSVLDESGVLQRRTREPRAPRRSYCAMSRLLKGLVQDFILIDPKGPTDDEPNLAP